MQTGQDLTAKFMVIAIIAWASMRMDLFVFICFFFVFFFFGGGGVATFLHIFSFFLSLEKQGFKKQRQSQSRFSELNCSSFFPAFERFLVSSQFVFKD